MAGHSRAEGSRRRVAFGTGEQLRQCGPAEERRPGQPGLAFTDVEEPGLHRLGIDAGDIRPGDAVAGQLDRSRLRGGAGWPRARLVVDDVVAAVLAAVDRIDP